MIDIAFITTQIMNKTMGFQDIKSQIFVKFTIITHNPLPENSAEHLTHNDRVGISFHRIIGTQSPGALPEFTLYTNLEYFFRRPSRTFRITNRRACHFFSRNVDNITTNNPSKHPPAGRIPIGVVSEASPA